MTAMYQGRFCPLIGHKDQDGEYDLSSCCSGVDCQLWGEFEGVGGCSLAGRAHIDDIAEAMRDELFVEPCNRHGA